MESFYKEALGQLQNVKPSHSLAHTHLAALLKRRFNVTPFSLKVQGSSPLGRSLTATLGLHVSSVTQSCLTLGDPMDCSPPGSSAHAIFQAGILDGLPCPPPGTLPKPGTEPTSPVSPVLAGNSLPLSHLKPLGMPYLYPEYPT